MKNGWTNFWIGYVQIRAEGKGLERLINDCLRNGIAVWRAAREGDHSISFFIRLKDVHAFRAVRRQHECRCVFTKREGFPFVIRRSFKNSGFVLGILLFLAALFMLSNMIWSVEVYGAKPETEHLIMKELDRIGVKAGAVQFLTHDADDIQKILTEKVPALTWVGVELNGTSYHLKVVEKNTPEQKEYAGPRNIVAKKKAVIMRMYVEQGQPAAMVNDHVEKGQLLVSGMIGSKGIPAKAEIYGETWYESSVEVPLKTNFRVFSGNQSNKHYISINGWNMQIWGFRQEEPDVYVTEEDKRELQFLGWKTPFSYIKEIKREKEEVSRSYTVKEAVKAGVEMGKEELMQKIGESGRISGEKVLHQENENGKVKLKILYQVIEDIVKTTPIVQGD
ncbi:sporulation protein YqfD [Bacillus sp. FJAT-42376]|uniref:sporulation protein YqfD n=1 Tax=Bacillus sp. FJAT-42376 TaxID=2014076 RepID=UPI000F4DE79E|nr:sporulation protein YqfD [Bacillus sp. FJAT-42376]AZB43671.1 sporulation protein YqfD [Bacillus sp. FJAT-42376]